jgi:hypothetical protein
MRNNDITLLRNRGIDPELIKVMVSLNTDIHAFKQLAVEIGTALNRMADQQMVTLKTMAELRSLMDDGETVKRMQANEKRMMEHMRQLEATASKDALVTGEYDNDKQ